jgi:hypothetical protein
MFKRAACGAALAAGVGLPAGCSDSRGVNTATGARVGAAAGQAVGDGRGRSTATLIATAIGAQIGASQPSQRTCLYRDPQTGQTYRAACR